MKPLTKQLLLSLYPEAAKSVLNLDLVVSKMNELCEKNAINSYFRMASFIAQTGHESGGFRYARENLNYSAEGLLKTFPKYFNVTNVTEYARNPQKIASKVYANRMGNGDEASGEGWKYCGRGLIQLTGKNNYTACGKFLNMDLVKDPSYLETPEGAVRSAIWFWSSNNLNAFADKEDILGMTKKINGGTIGLEDRKKHYEKCKIALI